MIKIKAILENKKYNKIFWAIIYLLVTLSLLVATCFAFDKFYYTFFYVSGSSMSPTLNNHPSGYYDFGIVDSHEKIFNYLKRYDIVITYYPSDYDEEGNLLSYADSKIKRVIGMPNETVTIYERRVEKPVEGVIEEITFNEIYITKGDETTLLELPFTPENNNGLSNALHTWTDNDYYSWKLGEDEYFVMGDNWGHSTDSTAKKVGPIKRSYMSGVLIAVRGYCQIKNNNPVNLVYTTPRYFKQ